MLTRKTQKRNYMLVSFISEQKFFANKINLVWLSTLGTWLAVVTQVLERPRPAWPERLATSRSRRSSWQTLEKLEEFQLEVTKGSAMMASFVLESVWRDSAGTLSSRTTRTKLGFERRLLEPVLKLDFPFTSSESLRALWALGLSKSNGQARKSLWELVLHFFMDQGGFTYARLWLG